MVELVKFECPRCQRPYELNLDLAQVKQKRQRAKCARCGERFDIASRVEAMRLGASGASVPSGNDVAGSAMAARLAAALRGTQDAGREVGRTGDVSSRVADEQQGFEEEGPPTVSDTPESLVKAVQAQIASTDQVREHESSELVEEDEVEEAQLPEPLDWLAAAGTGLEVLHRELSDRERELAELLAN